MVETSAAQVALGIEEVVEQRMGAVVELELLV